MTEQPLDLRPTRADVLQTLHQLNTGSLSRAAAVQWAKTWRDSQVPRDQFGAIPKDGLSRFAFWAILSVLESDQARGGSAPPYFIREKDLVAWESALLGVAEHRPGQHGAHGKTAHLNRSAPYLAGMIRIRPDHATDRIGLDHIRGCDDLDYYQELCFDAASGRQFFLWWRPFASFPGEAEVYLESEIGANEALVELLDILGLTHDDVAWRPDPSSAV